MQIYMIRHGQSEANEKGVYCGWAQVPLTEKGRCEAAHAGALLKKIAFDHVYTSDLKRAVQTCETALPSVAYKAEPLLRELDIGALAGMTEEEARKKYEGTHEYACLHSDYTYWGGENRRMELDRTRRFMQKLEQLETAENVAVFCHAGTICCMLQLILGVDFNYEPLRIDNGSVSIFRLQNKTWQLDKWNIT